MAGWDLDARTLRQYHSSKGPSENMCSSKTDVHKICWLVEDF
jgi:hypothetical protein